MKDEGKKEIFITNMLGSEGEKEILKLVYLFLLKCTFGTLILKFFKI